MVARLRRFFDIRTGEALPVFLTFLYIAVSDLLPHVSRHGKERQGRNLVALVAGLLLMLALARVTEH